MPGQKRQPFKPKRRRRVRPNKTFPTALKRIAERSLTVTPDDLRAYEPREIDLRIAEAMISGALLFKEISDHMKVTPAVVTRALKNPIRCAWLSQKVHENLAHRLGNADVALYREVLRGNVRAIELFYKRFDQIRDRSLHTHLHIGGFDPTKLPDEDLEKIIQRKMRGQIVDADFTPGPPDSKETDPPGGDK